MASRDRIVIVGAGIGGLTVAEQLRTLGFDGELHLIGDENHLPYSRPTLSKQVLLSGWTESDTTLKTQEQLRDLEINFVQGVEALSLDTKARKLNSSLGPIGFDSLVIATGSKANHLDSSFHIPSIRTLEDSLWIRGAMEKAKSVLVIGAGVLGSEIASAAKSFGAEVGLMSRSQSLSFGSLGDALSIELVNLHQANGVEIFFNSTILGIERVDELIAISLGDGRMVQANLVISAIGSKPCVDWLADSNLDLSDGVVCASNGCAAPGIFAIGDVAAWPDPFTGIPTRIEHQSNAIEQGISVANTILYGSKGSPTIPFFWSEIHGAKIKAYGWFNDPSLELSHQQAESFLISNTKEKKIRGVVGWNTPPKIFNQSRLLVDQSVS